MSIVQELPENQGPEVSYNLIELTGERRELGTLVEESEKSDAEKPKKRGRKKNTPTEDQDDTPVEEASAQSAALPRELGS